MDSEGVGGKTGLVLAGGGARAAYQSRPAGDARHPARPEGHPVAIICAPPPVPSTRVRSRSTPTTSARGGTCSRCGAIRAAPTVPADFPASSPTAPLVRRLPGRPSSNRPSLLLDNRPLEGLLARALDSSASRATSMRGALDAVAITCSGYNLRESCSFFQGVEALEGWKLAADRHQERIGVSPLMGRARSRSSSPVPLNRESSATLYAACGAHQPRAALGSDLRWS